MHLIRAVAPVGLPGFGLIVSPQKVAASESPSEKAK
jgi:hypothetical protein